MVVIVKEHLEHVITDLISVYVLLEAFFCLATLSTEYISDDMLTFSTDELSDLGITNLIQFTNIATSVSICSITYISNKHSLECVYKSTP